jgi:hypothetical protein
MARIEIIVMWIEASGEEELALQVAPASSSSVQGHTDGVQCKICRPEKKYSLLITSSVTLVCRNLIYFLTKNDKYLENTVF